MVCGNDGVPKPKTKWFFMRHRFEEVVRMNSSGRVFTVKNLTSQDWRFFYCNVSNIHRTTRSRMARLDVLEFTPGKLRITVSLKLARCAFASFPVNASNCTDDHYAPSLQVDYAGLQTFFREITATQSVELSEVSGRNRVQDTCEATALVCL